MNLKLIGMNLINFDNVLHVSFGKDQDGTNLKASFRFVDGSEREFGHHAAMTLLEWIGDYLDAEVDPLGRHDDVAAMIEGFKPGPDVEPAGGR